MIAHANGEMQDALRADAVGGAYLRGVVFPDVALIDNGDGLHDDAVIRIAHRVAFLITGVPIRSPSIVDGGAPASERASSCVRAPTKTASPASSQAPP